MENKIVVKYHNNIAFHPGYYIKEYIDEMGFTKKGFACMLGITPSTLNELVSGDRKLTTEIAYKLSELLGTSMEVWLNIQKTFDKSTQKLFNTR
ncbi:HigA family addiction module antitoxin [Ruminococcus sp. LCP21S3_E8]